MRAGKKLFKNTFSFWGVKHKIWLLGFYLFPLLYGWSTLCKSEKIVLLLRRDLFRQELNDSLKSGGKLKTFEKDVIKQGEATTYSNSADQNSRKRTKSI